MERRLKYVWKEEIKKVFVDTAPFIYFIEKDSNNPQYHEKVKAFFKDGYNNDKKFASSVITMEEYFVFPYRNKVYSFIDMFNRLVKTTDMEIVEINQEIAKKAAQIRAEFFKRNGRKKATESIMIMEAFW